MVFQNLQRSNFNAKRDIPTPFEEVTAFMIVEMGGYSHPVPLFIPALYDVVFFLYDLYNLFDP